MRPDCFYLAGLLFVLQAQVLCGQVSTSEDDAPLPKIAEMELPSAQTLLREKPVDWIVLKNDDTLVVEPVAPRPDTLTKMEDELRKLANVRPQSKAEQELLRERRLELLRLQVTLLEQTEDPDYTLDTRQIKQIVYHEDHVLERAGRCIDEGQTATAFELLVYLDRRHHNWPGYQKLVNRLLLKEASVRLEQNDPEAALRFCEELYGKDKSFAGLSATAGQAVDVLVRAAADADDFRQARHFLGRLAAREAAHPIVEKWRADFSERTTARMDEARQAASENRWDRAVSLIDSAARIWPETPGLRDLHRELSNRYPILRVGVLDLPGDPTRNPFPTPAQERWKQLRTLSWFEASRFDETGTRFRSPVCEAWEPDDLGRELRFAIRRDRADWETRPRWTSLSLGEELAARLRPDSPLYDERLAGNIVEFATPTPFEFTVRFRHAPLRPEALFRFPLTVNAEASELNLDLTVGNSPHDVRFRKIPSESATCRAVRTRPEPTSAKQRHVAEIVEKKYDTWESLLQALQRGEISAVNRVAHRDLTGLRDDPRFFVLPYAQPVSHVIQIHPQSAALKNGQLRRALLHALPRETLLWEELLPNVSRNLEIARLTTSPITQGTPSYSRLLPQPENDFVLAAGLAATARKGFGGALPPLKIALPDDPSTERAVTAMIKQWQRIGIQVIPTVSATDDWDLCYRLVQFREPMVDLWPFLSLDPSARIVSLNSFPERIRRQMLELERATSFADAMQILSRIQSDLLIDAWWIPLWEIDEFLLVRRNVTGLPDRPVRDYQDVERWVIQPWYPQDTP